MTTTVRTQQIGRGEQAGAGAFMIVIVVLLAVPILFIPYIGWLIGLGMIAAAFKVAGGMTLIESGTCPTCGREIKAVCATGRTSTWLRCFNRYVRHGDQLDSL